MKALRRRLSFVQPGYLCLSSEAAFILEDSAFLWVSSCSVTNTLSLISSRFRDGDSWLVGFVDLGLRMGGNRRK